MASPTVAANAYAALSRMMETGGAEKAGPSAGGAGPSFSALLKDAVGSVLESGKKSDVQTMAMKKLLAVGESETLSTRTHEGAITLKRLAALTPSGVSSAR